jgi:DNA-binding NtrC family response regulator
MVPALREHKEDLPELIAHLCFKHAGRVLRLSDGCWKIFNNYSWPGNVRELSNLLAFLTTVCDSETIEVADLPESFIEKANQKVSSRSTEGLHQHLELCEFKYIQEKLKLVGGNAAKLADLLKLSRSQVYEKLKKHGLSKVSEFSFVN